MPELATAVLTVGEPQHFVDELEWQSRGSPLGNSECGIQEADCCMRLGPAFQIY